MAQATTKDLTTLPVGRLGLIPLISCKDLGEKVNEWLIQWRKERSHEELDSFAFEGYQRESYLIPVQTARFGSGEAKCTIMESVRGDDIYLMVDVCNYSLTYSIGPYENLMSVWKTSSLLTHMTRACRMQHLCMDLRLYSHPISLSKLFSIMRKDFTSTTIIS